MASREENINQVVDYHQLQETSLADLRTLMSTLGGSAFKQVTITGTGFEGGNANGQLTFPVQDYLAGVMKLIRHLDSDAPDPIRSSIMAHNNFSQRCAEL